MIVVLTDSGGSSADMLGTATGAMITSDAYADTITSINSVAVSIPLSFGITVLSTAGTITSFTGEKTIGFGMGNQAILDFSGTVAFASARVRRPDRHGHQDRRKRSGVRGQHL